MSDNPTPAVQDVVPTMPDNKAAEANAQLAAIRAKPHNGKTYQADDVDANWRYGRCL